jgi:hypothetical protein
MVMRFCSKRFGSKPWPLRFATSLSQRMGQRKSTGACISCSYSSLACTLSRSEEFHLAFRVNGFEQRDDRVFYLIVEVVFQVNGHVVLFDVCRILQHGHTNNVHWKSGVV